MNGESPTPPPPPLPDSTPDDIPFAQQVPVSYATAGINRRPGLVTAIGVISIVLGIVGFFYAGVGILQSVALYTLSAVNPAPNRTVVATQPTAAATTLQLTPINPTTFVTALNQSAGNAISPAAQRALTQMLANPAQTHAPPGTLPGQVTVALDGTGGGFFTFPGGDIVTVSGDGRSTSVMNFSTGTGISSTNPFASVDQTPIIAMGVTAILSGLLAIYLFIAGVVTLRNSLRARRLHWIYVWLKLALSTLSMLLSYWVYTEMFTTFDSSEVGPREVPYQAVVFLAITFVLAIAYPLGLMIALRARSVCAFYRVEEGASQARVVG